MHKRLHFRRLIAVQGRSEHGISNSTAETNYPPDNSAQIHTLVSVNIQNALLNSFRFGFFHTQRKLNDTHPLHTHFHFRRYFAKLSSAEISKYIRKFQIIPPCHKYPPLTACANMIKQEVKIFVATLV